MTLIKFGLLTASVALTILYVREARRSEKEEMMALSMGTFFCALIAFVAFVLLF